MRVEQAWGAFSLVFALAVIAVTATFYSLGHDPYLVGAVAAVVTMVYLYILYKRYHIELVTEGDIALFRDPDDLRILCEIYGLGSTGKAAADRMRLRDFVRAHPDRAFVWVAPKPVRSIGSALAMPLPPVEEEMTVPAMMKMLLSDRPSEASLTGPLVGGRRRSSARLASMRGCPVCDAPLGRSQAICLRCGADLEFYSVLAESRVGRKLLSAKTEARKRKLRYPG